MVLRYTSWLTTVTDFLTLPMQFVKYTLGMLMGKEVIRMETNGIKRIRCPECLNYMTVTENDKGCLQGVCSVCHSKISSKRHSAKEKLIRVIRP